MKLPSEYITIILFSVIKEPFKKWVDRQMDERNARIKDDKDLCAVLDPDVYAALMKSTSISSKLIPCSKLVYSKLLHMYTGSYLLFYCTIAQKGNSHNLFKAAAKRRRSRAEIDEDKEIEKR